MKSDNYVKNNIIDIKNKALIARGSLNELILSIDDMLDITNTQNMIIHYYKNGCSYQEIANRVGLSYAAVRNRCIKLKADGLID